MPSESEELEVYALELSPDRYFKELVEVIEPELERAASWRLQHNARYDTDDWGPDLVEISLACQRRLANYFEEHPELCRVQYHVGRVTASRKYNPKGVEVAVELWPLGPVPIDYRQPRIFFHDEELCST